MNISKKVHSLALSSIIAALYMALTFMQEYLLPGTTSMAIQFRASEALVLLCVFTPAAIPSVTVGCFIANLVSVGALPVDMIMGTFASFLAATFAYKLRNMTFKNIPVVSALMPAVFNGLIIGLEIEIFFIEGPFNFVSFLTQCAFVFIGEVGVCMTLGLLLVRTIRNKKLEKYFSGFLK